MARNRLIVDAMNILWRGARSPGRLSVAGVPTSCIYGFIRAVTEALEFLPDVDSVVAVFEGGTADWRRAILPEYKRRKPKALSEAAPVYAQAEVLRDPVLPLMGVYTVRVPGVEADDVIAHLAREARMKATIFSSDSDFWPLVSETCSVIRPGKGGLRLLTPFTFEALTGWATPERALLAKAIVGDPSDGIPGVPGVGEATAKKLLAGPGDPLDAIMAADARTRAGLVKAHLPVIMRNLGLMDLRGLVVEDPWEYIEPTGAGISPPVVRALCMALGFRELAGNMARWLPAWRRVA